MQDIADLVRKAQEAGVKLEVVNGNGELSMIAPKKAQHWFAKLTPHKADIIRLLQGEA